MPAQIRLAPSTEQVSLYQEAKSAKERRGRFRSPPIVKIRPGRRSAALGSEATWSMEQPSTPWSPKKKGKADTKTQEAMAYKEVGACFLRNTYPNQASTVLYLEFRS